MYFFYSHVTFAFIKLLKHVIFVVEVLMFEYNKSIRRNKLHNNCSLYDEVAPDVNH